MRFFGSKWVLSNVNLDSARAYYVFADRSDTRMGIFSTATYFLDLCYGILGMVSCTTPPHIHNNKNNYLFQRKKLKFFL